jgi:hypothetical protein
MRFQERAEKVTATPTAPYNPSYTKDTTEAEVHSL